MTKAIFFDIDGTLVPFGEHGVPAEVKEAVAGMRRRGMKVFICTGRHIEWVDNVDGLEVDGFVTVNGAMCCLADRKTVIYSNPIPADDLERLIERGPETGLAFVVVPEEGGIFINQENHYVVGASKMLNLPQVPVLDLSAARGKRVVQMLSLIHI